MKTGDDQHLDSQGYDPEPAIGADPQNENHYSSQYQQYEVNNGDQFDCQQQEYMMQ